MNGAAGIDWRIGAAALARPVSADATAVVVSLNDPAIEPLLRATPTERDLADLRFPGASSRARFLERRVFMRSALAAMFDRPVADIVVGYDDAGAPRLLAPDVALHVSVAGRDHLAAFAIGKRPVGIDLEPMDQSVEPIDAVLHPNERQRLAALPAVELAEMFFRIWTMKEAYLKARRTGFLREASDIEVQRDSVARAGLTDAGVTVDCINEWRREKIASREVIAACVVLGDAFKP